VLLDHAPPGAEPAGAGSVLCCGASLWCIPVLSQQVLALCYTSASLHCAVGLHPCAVLWGCIPVLCCGAASLCCATRLHPCAVLWGLHLCAVLHVCIPVLCCGGCISVLCYTSASLCCAVGAASLCCAAGQHPCACASVRGAPVQSGRALHSGRAALTPAVLRQALPSSSRCGARAGAGPRTAAGTKAHCPRGAGPAAGPSTPVGAGMGAAVEAVGAQGQRWTGSQSHAMC